ncbi:hypothetical protein, partial [Salmonella sp. SAL4436]|uniref:hypothetical protein n=1 Tax=Salmonella sp. SAL4436 TaxID=3159891 RepID=UPI003978D848
MLYYNNSLVQSFFAGPHALAQLPGSSHFLHAGLLCCRPSLGSSLPSPVDGALVNILGNLPWP